jgi:alpha-ketoglutarate-dependent taurine dioxygenase
MLERVLREEFVGELTGLDLSADLEAGVARVESLLDRRPLLAVRDQDLEPADLVAFAHALGEPERFVEARPGYEEWPELAVYSNAAERGIVPQPYWHTDGLLREVAPALTVFYAVEAPSRGGDTLFLDARALHDELDPEDRATLDGLVAVLTTGARHPLVTTQARTGRRAIYANVPSTVGVVGVERESARRLLEQLYGLYDRPQATYRHRYRAGDLLIWDNHAVAHSATEPAPPGERRLVLRADIRPPAT